VSDRRPMNSLPCSARFRDCNGREQVVIRPASEDPDGFVHVVSPCGGGGGFFDVDRAACEVEVLWCPN
jgi:hypothetical protein